MGGANRWGSFYLASLSKPSKVLGRKSVLCCWVSEQFDTPRRVQLYAAHRTIHLLCTGFFPQPDLRVDRFLTFQAEGGAEIFCPPPPEITPVEAETPVAHTTHTPCPFFLLEPSPQTKSKSQSKKTYFPPRQTTQSSSHPNPGIRPSDLTGRPQMRVDGTGAAALLSTLV